MADDAGTLNSLRNQTALALKMLTLELDAAKIGEALELLVLTHPSLDESALAEAYGELTELLRPTEADKSAAAEQGIRPGQAVFKRLSQGDRQRVRSLAWEVFEWTEIHGVSLRNQVGGQPNVVVLPPEDPER